MNLKNIVASCCSLGCLVIILIGLFGYYLFFSDSRPYADETSAKKENVQQEPDKPVLMTVLFVSDVEDDFQSLERFVKVSNVLNPDVVFVLGDISSLGVRENMLKSKTLLGGLNSEVFFIPGDRDLWKSSGLDNFNYVFGDSYQVVERKGIKFLLVDNANEYEGISANQMDFITNNILDSDYVLMHNPIYFNKSLLGMMSKGMGQYSADVDNQRIKLLDMVRGSEVVKAVFAGDQHSFSVSEDEQKVGLNHVVLGSLNTDRNLDSPNFGLMKIYEDKSFYIEKYYLPIDDVRTE